ncbi:hypothetical protein RUM44_001131 [Polyplax serrata]|uniref:Uncharacterized protein n=1 Tax=Polyplax serrata TaxID=468196 RepID=A0ABR1B9Z6_POLSC
MTFYTIKPLTYPGTSLCKIEKISRFVFREIDLSFMEKILQKFYSALGNNGTTQYSQITRWSDKTKGQTGSSRKELFFRFQLAITEDDVEEEEGAAAAAAARTTAAESALKLPPQNDL